MRLTDPAQAGIWLEANARPVLAVLSALVIVWQVAAMIRERYSPKDPVRSFSSSQIAAASMRAGGRCEFSTTFGRCRSVGAHADHWVPHTRGGASTDDNLVWGCARHNLRKSSRMPTRMATWRIARRRRRYFPSGVQVRPGRRFR